MASPITSLLVNVIGRAGAGARARSDKGALSAANQSACPGADGRSDPDAFGGFFLACFRIASLHRARISVQQGTQNEGTGDEKHRYRSDDFPFQHIFFLLGINLPQW